MLLGRWSINVTFVLGESSGEMEGFRRLETRVSVICFSLISRTLLYLLGEVILPKTETQMVLSIQCENMFSK